jgi:methionine-rich copper-binding protein CopC
MKRSIYTVAALLFASSLAHAHSELTSSMPADKASVATAPKEVMLHFSEPVRLTAVSVTRSGGAKQDLSGIPAERVKDFTVAAPGLGDGQYEVSWRALSSDSHVMTGTFSFSVGAANPTPHTDHEQHTGAQAQPAHENHGSASHQR